MLSLPSQCLLVNHVLAEGLLFFIFRVFSFFLSDFIMFVPLFLLNSNVCKWIPQTLLHEIGEIWRDGRILSSRPGITGDNGEEGLQVGKTGRQIGGGCVQCLGECG